MPYVASMRNALLDRALSNTAFTVPTSIQFAPFSASPDAAGAGGTEISGNGFARRTVAFGTPTAAQASNSGSVVVGTASADQPVCSAFVLFDQAGNRICFGPTTPAKTVLSGQTWTLAPREVQIADAAQDADSFLTNYTMNGLIRELTGGAAAAFVAAPWWGLATARFLRDGTGGTEVSTSGTGYARVQRSLAGASGGAKAPSAAITFPAISGSPGTATHLLCFDASTGGNLLGQLKLATGLTLGAGVAPSFAAANQAFTLT